MYDYAEFENKMKKTCEALTAQLATIRAGRANAAVLDQIQVDYYGVPTPIQQLATVATPDPRSLVIQPWDASVLKGIERAILASDLGINPQNDGRAIRLVFPHTLFDAVHIPFVCFLYLLLLAYRHTIRDYDP